MERETDVVKNLTDSRAHHTLKERKSLGSIFKEGFQSIDLFGTPVRLNFNGK